MKKEAKSKFVQGQNALLPGAHSSYTTSQVVVQCDCDDPKHGRLVQGQTLTRGDNSFSCHIHSGKGSEYERQFYAVADKEPLLQLYAVEAVAITSKIQLSIPNSTKKMHLNKKPWDFVSLKPANLLAEIQGEGHTHKQDTRPNNDGDTVGIRQAKDQRMANAAKKQGYSVLWLYPGDAHGRHARWAAGLRQALQHVMAGLPPKLFKC